MSFGRLSITSQRLVGRFTLKPVNPIFGVSSKTTPTVTFSNTNGRTILTSRFFSSAKPGFSPTSFSFRPSSSVPSLLQPEQRLTLHPSFAPISSIRFLSTSSSPPSTPSASSKEPASASSSTTPPSPSPSSSTTISQTTTQSEALVGVHGIPSPVLWWTVAGLIPLGVGAGAVVAAPVYLPTAVAASLVFYQVTFATTLLAFMGGIHFGFAAVNASSQALPPPPAGWLRYSLTMVPFSIAWAAPALPIETSLTLLLAGYSSLILSEIIAAPKTCFPSWWLRLRFPVSLLVLSTLGTTYLLGGIPM